MKKVAIFLSLVVFLTVSCVEREQESHVSNVNFTPCQQTKAKSDVSDRIDVEFTNEGVQITYYNFVVTCDFTTVNVTHTFVNGVLSITQQGSQNHADCICHTDVSYTINGILKNEVNVIFINGVQVYCYNDSSVGNFYDVEYRIGLWVNPNRKDTLEFVNSSKLIRKGLPYKYEEYLYRIENNTLIINGSTYHPILKAEKDVVVIGNMYITVGFADNSGTFIKVEKEKGRGFDKDVIINPTEYDKLPIAFPIQDLKIVDDYLKMKICSSGCDGSSWIVKLVGCCISDAAIYPPQWELRVYFENKEICAAVPCREFSFNIKDLQIQGTNKVRLNISGNSILYEY